MLVGNPRYNPVILSMSFAMGGPAGSACVHTSGYVCVVVYTCLRACVFCSFWCWQFSTIMDIDLMVIWLISTISLISAFYSIAKGANGALEKIDRVLNTNFLFGNTSNYSRDFSSLFFSFGPSNRVPHLSQFNVEFLPSAPTPFSKGL